ncbi:leucine-rich_repeat domain-containing protein [Hexamita inflata]|uniref:Leucine-rich_repeat domain-containing protein n=1 Tax=Hexamita inflata TaxID=28002 RepID=A0ABP1GXB9_9EUKA
MYKNCIKLFFNNCVNISFYNAPLNVLHLTVQDCRLESIEGIHRMKSLLSLDLSNNALRDVFQLSKLSKLITLNLQRNKIVIIEHLNSISSLKLSSQDLLYNKLNIDQVKYKLVKKLYSSSLINNDIPEIVESQKPLSKSEEIYYKRFQTVIKVHGYNIQLYKQKTISKQRLFKTNCNKLLQMQINKLTWMAQIFVRFITEEYRM